MFLAYAPQYSIIRFALESSWMLMGGQVSWVILGGEFSFSIGFTITYERKHRALCCSLGCNQPLRNLPGMCSLPTDKPLCPDGKVCGPAIST